MSNYSYRHGVEQDKLVIYAAFVSTGRGGRYTVCLVLCGPLGPGRLEISTPHSVSASLCQKHQLPCADNRPPHERKLSCRLSEPRTLTHQRRTFVTVYKFSKTHPLTKEQELSQSLEVRGHQRSLVAKLTSGGRERGGGL